MNSKFADVFPSDNANIQGIIFDLDGTLYKMRWFMKPIMTILLFPHILRLPAYMAVRKNFMNKDFGAGSKLMDALAKDLAKKVGSQNIHCIKSWIFNRFYKEFVRIMPLFRGSRPNITATLKRLNNRGIKLAVLSDFAFIRDRMKGLDLDDNLFDIIESSETVGALKPSTRPFIQIAEQWNIPTKNILMIGDRLDTDGDGAINSGMMFLRIGDDKKKSNGKSWLDVKSYLDSL